MKIALAGTFEGRGGIQTHFRSLARALLDDGHEVRILSLGKEIPPNGDVKLKETNVWAGRCFHPYLDGASTPRSAFGAARAILRELRRFQPHVYLACGTGWNLFLPAWISLRCRRLVFYEVMSGVAGRSDSRWVVRWLFDEVVAQAEPVARNFRRAFGWKRAIRVLPAFSEPFEEVRSPDANAKRVPYGQARAAIFGRLVPHKRVGWLVTQWPRLGRSLRELHIFGTGPDAGAIRDTIRQNNCEVSVFCHGEYPSGQAYADLLGSFDLTLLPTIGAEGAPLVLLESMACGVPFVSTDAGGITDYANPDCIIVDRDDPDSFLRGVERLCEKLDSGSLDSNRLRNFYRTNFSFEALKTQWLDFFASLRVS